MHVTYLEILRHNKGFNNPEEWLKYAEINEFKLVEATKLSRCPGCDSEINNKIGQYVYFSNLACLLECKSCGLIYSDLRLNNDATDEFFENAYKDLDYFNLQRKDIFMQLAKIVCSNIRKGGKFIDVGGAQGHFGKIVQDLRPDLSITVSDVSTKACNYASSVFNFNTVCKNISNLPESGEKYDFVSLIDVIYYEDDIKKMFGNISNITDASILIRIPNKVLLIKYLQPVFKLLYLSKKNRLPDKIIFFNPEHLYLFSKKYLQTKLSESGFKNVRFYPSKSLRLSDRYIAANNIYYGVACLIYYLTFRKIIITTAQTILAHK